MRDDLRAAFRSLRTAPSFTAVALITYSASEVGFQFPSAMDRIMNIGGLLGGIPTNVNNANDFRLRFNVDTLEFIDMFYAVAGQSGSWWSTEGTVEATQVVEPASTVLLAVGLAGMGLRQRRLRRMPPPR
jgi:hypothetical protein